MVLFAIICLTLIWVRTYAELSLVEQYTEIRSFMRPNAFNGSTPVRDLKWENVTPIQGRWSNSLGIASPYSL